VKQGVHKTKNFIDVNGAVELVDFVAKSASLVYSIDAAIFLRLNELPKFGIASPFFGTNTI
jgi:hypothetical protein